MSSRGLIKSMLVIGGAQVANILISVLRMKVLAVLLGPAGVGLLSIYTSLLGTVSEISGLGIHTSGIREIASVRGEEPALSRVRVVLFAGNLLQGLIAMVLVWVWRAPLARFLFGDTARATEVGLVGVAVLFALLASSQTALLQGMRRIGDLGRVTVLAALAGTVAGLFAVWLRGEDALIWFVLIQPLTAIFVALYYTRKLPRPASARLRASAIWQVWRPMAALGVVFMLGGLATSATLLVVRGMVTRYLGLESAGLFAASWGITMQYIGFLLAAMAADYYPRLTEVIKDRPKASRLINDQIQLGLALGGPVLLLLIGLAPWVMTLLYSPKFAPAADMLQWQTVGNIFKLASWSIGFAFVAAAQSRVFLLTEIGWNLLFITMLWVGLPLIGLQIAGPAFLLAYALYLAVIYALARKLHGFRFEPLSLWLIAGHAALGFAVLALAKSAPVPGGVVSALLAMATGVIGLRVVLVKVGPGGKLTEVLAKSFEKIGWRIWK